MAEDRDYITWFEDLGNEDVPAVGGKNASLGEMIGTLKGKGISVPRGFATTARAYRDFVRRAGIEDSIRVLLDELQQGAKPLHEVGRSIRRLFLSGDFPPEISDSVRRAYRRLSEQYGEDAVDVAARSSATAEDLPEASFAGQQESYLNLQGEDEVLDACRKCYASLFTDRAISYRQEQGFDRLKVALSVGIQKMVRSDLAGAGVMFTIDTETGFPRVAVINASWGLGENVVKGRVNPDEYLIFKPLLGKDRLIPIIGKTLGDKEEKLVYSSGGSQRTRNVKTSRKERRSFVLTDGEILTLSRWGVDIEEHYGRPMDIEWAKDGLSGELFIVQARPETVQSRKTAKRLKTYSLKQRSELLARGLSVGSAIARGRVNLITDVKEIGTFEENAVLVTGMTDPDWVPLMKRAAAIVTDHGGRTSHAAIVSRELGIPAVVGTGNATEVLKDGQEITVSCAEGEEGHIYSGALEYEESEIDLSSIFETKVQIMMNIASPAAVFNWWRLPVKGVGLARMEFIINNAIKIHPMALVDYPHIPDRAAKHEIDELTYAYPDKKEYFVDHLAQGIARIAASRYPDPVIVRMSDFKTNEYASLIGGQAYEPEEDNPMLGFRGASRYYSDRYRPGFVLECRAVKKVREEMGLRNVVVMIPFCRTLEEADRVLAVLAGNGLRRGEKGLEIYVMCEIPSNVILADKFAQRFDGFSIGSNDLTQLVLGVDRDSAELAPLFDESNEAVKRMISMLIDKAHRAKRKVGLCGQAPSDDPDFAAFLVLAGIDSISLNPDSVIPVIERVAQVEGQTGSGG